MVQQGDLGDIILLHGHYLQDWLYYPTDYNWRLEPRLSGASRAVADIGTHWCDLVQFITGLKIAAVCANLKTVHPRRVKPEQKVDTFAGRGKHPARTSTVPISTEDTGTILLEFDNGAPGALTVSQVSAGRKNHEWFEIDGTKSAIAWDQEEPNKLWVGRREKSNEVVLKDPSLLHDGARFYVHYPGGHPEGYPDGLKNVFLSFYTYLQEGGDRSKKPPPFPTFADGHWENRVVEAVLTSNRKRGWVRVRK
jgi:predicted dehydrogenase